jgi:hypothetical protein
MLAVFGDGDFVDQYDPMRKVPRLADALTERAQDIA